MVGEEELKQLGDLGSGITHFVEVSNSGGLFGLVGLEDGLNSLDGEWESGCGGRSGGRGRIGFGHFGLPCGLGFINLHEYNTLEVKV
jgi:hypothetical protein